MIVTDKFGSTSVSELVNIYTIERNIEHRESNEYEVYEIMFQFRRTESKDLISILWSYVMTSLGEASRRASRWKELYAKYSIPAKSQQETVE